ncbi:MAG: hypothetical protein WCD86_19080 [Ktedonobacteraceae bacterium]
MKPLDDLTSEEQQHEELVMDLRRALNKAASLSAEEQAKHLARVRERLFQSKQAGSETHDLLLQPGIIASHEQRDGAPIEEGPILTSPRRRSRFLHTVNMLAAVAVVCALIGSMLLVLTHFHIPKTSQGYPGSGQTTSALPTTSPQITFAFIAFTEATSYPQALRIVTDLGLQPTSPCIGTILNSDGKISSWFWWGPQAEGFAGYPHGMYIAPTPLASSDWLARLRALSNVTAIQTTHFVFYCQLDHTGTPPPSAIVALAPQQAGTYLTVTFSPRAGSYDQALQEISNLGLRLADPCLERIGKRPGSGYSAGQEQKYAATHMLLATTPFSPNNWQKQLAALAGVTSFHILTSITCR